MAAVSDADRRVWELIEDVPKLPKPVAWGCGILNFFFAGTGTIASAFLCDKGFNRTQLFVGLM